MKNITILILTFLFTLSLQSTENAEFLQSPTVYINQSVDVISGKSIENIPHDNLKTEYYQRGNNEVGEITVTLPYWSSDFRLGRVRLQKSPQGVTYFLYFPGYTEVLDSQGRKTVYRYSDRKTLDAIEHYCQQGDQQTLYRVERLYWNHDFSKPKLSSRTLEDSHGKLWSCKTFEYDSRGFVIQETLYGILTGKLPIILTVDEKGRPNSNGIESYSIRYTYSSDQNYPMLLKIEEQDGLTTLYQYDPKTHLQTAEFKITEERILKRTFYLYDDKKFLYRTICDDGSGETVSDLADVTKREVINTYPFEVKKGLYIPSIIEKVQFDSEENQEILLEKKINTYSPEGKLIKEEFFGRDGKFLFNLAKRYDEKGRLIETTDSRGNREKVVYSKHTYETILSTCRGDVTSKVADLNGHLLQRTEKSLGKDPHTLSYRYNDFGQKTADIDRFGNETTYVYDDLGRPTHIIYPSVLDENGHLISPAESFEYDIVNNVVTAVDSKGFATKTRYNVRNQPIEVIYPDGTSESFQYNLNGSLRAKKEKNGKQFIYQRDVLNRLLETEELSSKNERLNKVFYTYFGSQLKSMEDLHGCKTCYKYDSLGREKEVTITHKGIQKRKTFSYDDENGITETKEWFGPGPLDFIVTSYEKNSEGDPIAVIVSDGNGVLLKKTEMEHSEAIKASIVERSHLNEYGQYVLQRELTNSSGTVTISTFDARGRVLLEIIRNGMGQLVSKTEWRYDANGNKAVEIHSTIAGGVLQGQYAKSWKYGPMNRLEEMIEGFGSSSPRETFYQYDTSGELSSTKKPDGVQLFYQYDSAGHLCSLRSSDGTIAYQYFYNAEGLLGSIIDEINHQTTFRTYKAFQLVKEEKLGHGFSTRNHYDSIGRRTKLSLHDGSSIEYKYKTVFLNEITRRSSAQKTLYSHRYEEYNLRGHAIKSTMIGLAGALGHVYDDVGRVKAIESSHWSEIIPNHGVNESGSLIKRIIKDFELPVETHYSYTEKQQLCDEKHLDSIKYTYDSLHNRLSQNGLPEEIGELNELISTTEGSFVYDRNGNLIERKWDGNQQFFEYDALNRLIKILTPGKTTIRYTYDSFNRRLSRIEDEWNGLEKKWCRICTSSYLYDGDNEIGSVDGAGQISQLRVLGLGSGAEISSAVALEINGKVYAPIHDRQGSIRCLIDAKTGKPEEYYRYTAFGQQQIFDSAGQSLLESKLKNPWGFSSKRLDRESGFIYFGKRYYDPAIARWITPDPVSPSDSPNPYAYVQNNPLSYLDLYGLFSIASVFDGISSIAFYIIDALSNASTTFSSRIADELYLSEAVKDHLDSAIREFLGYPITLLSGYDLHESDVKLYGKGEVSDKVRITLINGILNRYSDHMANLQAISQTHGGINIHSVFHATGGWSWDVIGCLFIKAGYVSSNARRLAEKWRELIQEMGGTDGEGTIIHYAHSLGGADTAAARSLMTPEELKMIHVITLGSPKLVDEDGFATTRNYVAWRDGVCIFATYGYLKSLWTGKGSFEMVGSPFGIPFIDHTFRGYAYYPILETLGGKFQKIYGSLPNKQ